MLRRYADPRSAGAVSILRKHLSELKICVVNVVDLMKLQSPCEHPHGLSDRDYDTLFTTDKHVIFAFHGYPTLVHRLTYRRTNRNFDMRAAGNYLKQTMASQLVDPSRYINTHGQDLRNRAWIPAQ